MELEIITKENVVGLTKQKKFTPSNVIVGFERGFNAVFEGVKISHSRTKELCTTLLTVMIKKTMKREIASLFLKNLKHRLLHF